MLHVISTHSLTPLVSNVLMGNNFYDLQPQTI